MKKNTAAFVLALIGAIFGLIGGIVWAALADFTNAVGGTATVYLVCFIVLGIGGAIIALIGGILAFGYKKGGFGATLFGFLMQVGMLVAACVAVKGFSFLMNLCTLVAIILLLIAVILAHKQPKSE